MKKLLLMVLTAVAVVACSKSEDSQEWIDSPEGMGIVSFGVENKGNFFDELRGKNIFAPSGTINGATVRNVIKDYVLIQDEIEERPQWSGNSRRNYWENYND